MFSFKSWDSGVIVSLLTRVIHSTTSGSKEAFFLPFLTRCSFTSLWFLSKSAGSSWQLGSGPAIFFPEPEQHLPAWHCCFALRWVPRVGVLGLPPLCGTGHHWPCLPLHCCTAWECKICVGILSWRKKKKQNTNKWGERTSWPACWLFSYQISQEHFACRTSQHGPVGNLVFRYKSNL